MESLHVPSTENHVRIAANVAEIRERIAAAARRAGRSPDEVTLIAVTKTHPVELIRSAQAAGLKIFGESRIQEALPKIDALGSAAECHLIGHLQRNKAAAAVGRFALIHSVDSVRLIEALEQKAAAMGINQRILLQLNVSGEKSKYGSPPEDLPLLLDALDKVPHLMGEGLMTIPPLGSNPEDARPYFAELRHILSNIPATHNLHPRHLSMGMSGDYEIAIEEGATLVRIGSAIFGPRL